MLAAANKKKTEKKHNVINLKAEDIYSEMDQISSAFFDMLIL